MSEHSNTLYSPYNKEDPDYPQEETAIEFFLNQTDKQCQLGNGQIKWITNAQTGEYCTFDQVDSLSRSVASGLYKRGMRRGDILLYSSHNTTRLHVFFMGVWRANGAVRAIYPEETVQRMTDVMIENKVKWFLCDPHSVGQVSDAIKKVPWPVELIVFGQVAGCTWTQQLFNDDGKCCPQLEVGPKDMALILPTSGTTGMPKGCLHTHDGLLDGIYSLTKRLYGGQSLLMGRQTHLSGCCLPFAYMISGMQFVTVSTITKKIILQAVHEYKPILVFGFPKFLLYLNEPEAKNYDLSSIHYIMTGGMVITPGFVSSMESLSNVRVIITYAMSEGGMFTSTQHLESTNENDRIWPNVPDFSCGKLLHRVMLQVRDVETGQPLGPNQRGELCFKSPCICSGYLHKPEETEKTFPNRWLRTGDMGYYDENGFVFAIERIKEIFKYYNNHISPSELEYVIQSHPAVNNVSVVGVPDPEGGDRIPRAFVTLKDPKALASDIKKFANEKLASYQQLRGGLIVLHELPIGKSGKYNTDLLKQIQIA